MRHLNKNGLRRPGRRVVVSLVAAVAYQFRGLASREVAILVHEVRIAIPALRFHSCPQAHHQDKRLEAQSPKSEPSAQNRLARCRTERVDQESRCGEFLLPASREKARSGA